MSKGNPGNRFSEEVRARAVRLVLENESNYKTRSECCKRQQSSSFSVSFCVMVCAMRVATTGHSATAAGWQNCAGFVFHTSNWHLRNSSAQLIRPKSALRHWIRLLKGPFRVGILPQWLMRCVLCAGSTPPSPQPWWPRSAISPGSKIRDNSWRGWASCRASIPAEIQRGVDG